MRKRVWIYIFIFGALLSNSSEAFANQCQIPPKLNKGMILRDWNQETFDFNNLLAIICEKSVPRTIHGILNYLENIEHVVVIDFQKTTYKNTEEKQAYDYYKPFIDAQQKDTEAMTELYSSNTPKGTIAAKFLSPYTYLSKEDLGGPFMSRPKVLLKLRNRDLLVHEIIHYLYWKYGKRKLLNKFGRPESEESTRDSEYRLAWEQFNQSVAGVDESQLIQFTRFDQIKNQFDAGLRVINSEVDSYDPTVGEEVNVIYVTTAYADTLNINPDLKRQSAFYLNLLIGNTRGRLKEWMVSWIYQIGQTRFYDIDETSQKKFLSLREKMDKLELRFQAALDEFRKL